jgi:hypothetical protein
MLCIPPDSPQYIDTHKLVGTGMIELSRSTLNGSKKLLSHVIPPCLFPMYEYPVSFRNNGFLLPKTFGTAEMTNKKRLYPNAKHREILFINAKSFSLILTFFCYD